VVLAVTFEGRENKGKKDWCPPPTRLVCTTPRDDLRVSKVEDPCSGYGGIALGVWRLSPEDEAKCYINVHITL